MSENLNKSHYQSLPVNEHLVLRQVDESEVDSFFQLVDDNREYLAEYLPWVDKNKSTDDTHSFIKEVQYQRLEGSLYGFGIYSDDVLVGHISLMHVTDDSPPEIGYWISQDSSGRGIVTSAAKAVTDFGLGVLNLGEIVIKARTNNIASNKVAEKLGYEISGTEKKDNETLNIWRKT